MDQFFECEPEIVKHISRKVKDKSRRDDLLHEIFIKFAAKFHTIKHQDNLCGYLYRITDNAITDFHRVDSRFYLTDDESTFERAGPDSTITDTYKLADWRLRLFIDQLPPKYREALVLIDLEGKSQKEVAEEVGISYSGLKSLVQRAREMLKNAILNCCDYEFDKYGNIVGCCNGEKLN